MLILNHPFKLHFIPFPLNSYIGIISGASSGAAAAATEEEAAASVEEEEEEEEDMGFDLFD